MGEACTSRKLKPALGTRTRTRIDVNVALLGTEVLCIFFTCTGIGSNF